LYGEADPIIHVPDPYDPNRSVAVRRSSVQPAAGTPPRDLAPLPLLDPLALRMLGAGVGGGVFAAGVGYGVGQIISAIAGGVTGIALLALLLLMARFTAPSMTTKNIAITNHNRWWGSSNTRT
jgi:hypothetical protein